ncbi:uncharacterized protein [Miscanthus floridulus]|uniref:uncharacterized protein n=1 Tax=Miscanthus floridulus TaxID=154761 RepID=UPI003457E443
MRNHHKLAPTPSSSSKNNNKAEQPHLSGAYIRSLVKQLSSSSSAARSKDHSTMSTKPHSQPPQEDYLLQQQAQTAPPPQQQQQPHKKQVRRRLHTSRPYQERLLNMAEARREIVTALKIHRASMRQAKEQQQQQQLMQLQLQRQQEVHHLVQEPSQAATGASSAPSYASYYSDYLYNSPFSHFTAPTPSSYSSSPLRITYDAPVAPPMLNSSEHNLDDHLVPLPAQPLGLNLSFQGFNSSSVIGDDTKNSTCSFDPPLLQPSPASSYSVYSSPSVTMASHDLSAVTMENTSLAADPSLHRVLDDEEMAAIYSIGQQHDIEWSDTMNLVTSAWWSKLLESIEDKGNGTVVDQEAGGAANLTEDPSLVDMPDWVSDSLGHVATQESNSDFPGIHLNDYYHQDEDVSLPLTRVDIGDIEGWDTEWFS